jgi:CheY-like chemotaxis protein
MFAKKNSPPPKKIVFVVDDDPAHLRACERILKRSGYHVVTATNGASALRTLALTTVDLLLCDIFLPERDGFEIIQTVRRRTPGIPIIAMSGGGVVTSREDVLKQAGKLGAKTLLEKPFSESELTRVVAEALGVPAKDDGL